MGEDMGCFFWVDKISGDVSIAIEHCHLLGSFPMNSFDVPSLCKRLPEDTMGWKP